MFTKFRNLFCRSYDVAVERNCSSSVGVELVMETEESVRIGVSIGNSTNSVGVVSLPVLSVSVSL